MRVKIEWYKWAIGIAALLVLAVLVIDDYEAEATFLAFLYFVVLFYLGVRQLMALLKLKNEHAKTELSHLQSQVNPHFFFNTLNNLYGLVEKDPKKAQDLILRLSDMMRYSIYDGQKEEVTLEEEVAYLKNYIDLHKMRYHKKIDITFDLEVHDEGYKVLPLLFINLLENAFKHGVENLSENAFVHIDLVAEENEIHFVVENNFDHTELADQPGIGLKNLKRRLDLVYPKKRHFFSVTTTENVYKAELTLKQL